MYVAIKVLDLRAAKNPAFYQSLQRQTVIQRELLSHPNIVRAFELGEDGDLAYLAMAWVDGISLRQHISDLARPIMFSETADILRPVCWALQYAHGAGVFHCDVKSSNILLSADREVFLTDFGLSKYKGDAADGNGTLPYMAPEQFNKGEVGAWTDIYALGILFYEMLSGGAWPYRDDGSAHGSTRYHRLAFQHTHSPVPSSIENNPDIPLSVIEVLQWAISKSPPDRFVTTMDFFGALEQAGAPRRA